MQKISLHSLHSSYDIVASTALKIVKENTNNFLKPIDAIDRSLLEVAATAEWERQAVRFLHYANIHGYRVANLEFNSHRNMIG